MIYFRINNKQYSIDFNRFEIVSIETNKTFTFSETLKVSELRDYLLKVNK